MSSDTPILPAQLVQSVDMYVDRELDSCRKYSNREPLDESGVYSLHLLAAEIYAAAWEDGRRATEERHRGRLARERAAAAADEDRP